MTFPLPSSASESTSDLKSILHKPLILGASVSADYFTQSPGKRLALRYTEAKDIKVKARHGNLGKDIVKALSASDLSDRTLIIGMDLFFWDSLKMPADETLRAVDQVIGLAAAKNIPILLGDIPGLMPFMQKSMDPINAHLTKSCRAYQRCRILPLQQILQTTLQQGGIEHRGTKYGLSSLIPDGLHVASPASEYLADKMEELLKN